MQHIARALYLLSALSERCWHSEKWPLMKGNVEVTHPFLLHRNKENADFSLLQIGLACKCCMPSAPKWTLWSSPWSPHFLWCVNRAKEQDCTISCVFFYTAFPDLTSNSQIVHIQALQLYFCSPAEASCRRGLRCIMKSLESLQPC